MRSMASSQRALMFTIIASSILFTTFSPQANAAVVNLSKLDDIEDLLYLKHQSELPGLLEDEASSRSSAASNHGQGHQETKVLASKFLILTTGNEIKLYPLGLSSQQNKTLTNNGDYYLIRPVDFDVNDSDLPKRLGANSSFTRWLFEREAIRAARSDGSKRLSILPSRSKPDHSAGNFDDRDDELYQGASGWRRPWISDVDYFFDSTFCLDQNSEDNRPAGPYTTDSCLVVVWLDKRNKFVRFGSINLNEHPIEDLTAHHLEAKTSMQSASSSPSTKKRDKVLWLHEFPPIDICNRAGELDIVHSVICDVSELAVQRARHELHITIYSEKLQIDRILSGQLRPSTIQREQFTDISLMTLRFCPSAPESRSNSGLKNLNIDETSGHWLFYMNRHNPTRIMGLDLSSRQSNGLIRRNRMSHFGYALQAVVKDTRFDSSACRHEYTGMKDREPYVLTMTVDRAKLYWMMDNHEIFSSDLAAANVQLVGKLSAKPLIRSPDVMRMFHDTLFFSDTSRKSIMTYRLNKQPLNQENQLAGSETRPNHQVLLVETPTIYGFRLIDMDTIASDDTLELEGDEAMGRVAEVHVNPTEPQSWFGYWFSLGCRGASTSESRDVYEMLTKRARAGCDHMIPKSRRQNWVWKYYVCFSIIMMATVIILSAILTLALRLRCLAPRKEEELTNDTNPIKYSV